MSEQRGRPPRNSTVRFAVDRFRKRLAGRGLLADELDHLIERDYGLRPSSRKYLRGLARPSIEALYAISKVFCCRMEDLLEEAA